MSWGVAVGSIRPRILKGETDPADGGSVGGCSGLDPTEDTESLDTRRCVGSCARAVAVGSIRPRILKVRDGVRGSGLHPGGCSGLDPTEDTESCIRRHPRQPPHRSCSGLDPTEDTERRWSHRGRSARSRVAVGSIRPRILKGLEIDGGVPRGDRCSGLDPTEDTESPGRGGAHRRPGPVAVGSIRPRILKVPLNPSAGHDGVPALQWARSDRGY